MVAFLVKHCREEGYTVEHDEFKNVYVTKGEPVDGWYPAVGAHIDTVHRKMDVEIVDELDRFIGVKRGTSERVGIGADCKTGVFVCLELLRLMPTLKVVFFAMEEIGCLGARGAKADFFSDIGYFIEFDCPSKNMMSYTSSGVRLFDNEGPFIDKAFPVLEAYSVKWQHHPYTDVSVIRPRFNMSCLNLSSGYYNWHMPTEFAYLPDVKNAVEMGVKLIQALGSANYPFVGDGAPPKVKVTYLAIASIV